MMKNLENRYQEFLSRIGGWPGSPGIYVMKDGSGRILYVGKAKNLKKRIRSYFQKIESLTSKTRVLVNQIQDLEFTVTNTELEALLLECNLIKKHRPRYNIRLKDDKNYPYVVLDFTHPFPQFRMTRKVIVSPHLKYFGPFTGSIHEIGRFLLKTFQIRDCSDAKFRNRTRPCLNYEIGTCTGPCVGLVSQESYAEQIQEAVLFLKGRGRELLSSLKSQMKLASNRLEYEKARILRDKIRSIERITEKQNTVMTDKMKDIDVVGRFVQEEEIQWVVLFIRSGLMTGRRAEKTPLVGSLEETTQSFLEQFYQVSLIPDEVWLDTDFSEREGVQKFLTEKVKKQVSVLVKRSEKPMRLLGMAHENAKLLFQEKQKTLAKTTAETLKEILGLSEIPHSIEGIDVSNVQGEAPAVALVHFADEHPLKERYRIYHPRTVEGQNDFGMIYEVVQRRFSKPDPPPPDLLLIDGGKGQLNAAFKALDELSISLPVCALAKSRTQSAFSLKEVERSNERIFVKNRKNPIILREGNPALALLQRVRDEAHRFSVKHHSIRRKKAALKQSDLLSARGIGETTRRKLLQHFGSVESVHTASIDALVEAGLSRKQAESVNALGKEEE